MWRVKLKTNHSNNISHKWKSMWYKATQAFDMILLYLKNHDWRTTKDTSLQEFQTYIVKYIDEFIAHDQKLDTYRALSSK